jgi:hypothetical protein
MFTGTMIEDLIATVIRAEMLAQADDERCEPELLPTAMIYCISDCERIAGVA